jgi:hypothetical protein
MTHLLSARQIRQCLVSSAADRLPLSLRPLACAAWQIKSDRKTHARCRVALGALVNAEMDGNFALCDASVREHLLLCPRCASLYAELLEISLLESLGRLPRPAILPVPDLSFLEMTDGSSN